jgi:4-amino-4-deoxy-L-arabinose transferase-like glycosyltransferase
VLPILDSGRCGEYTAPFPVIPASPNPSRGLQAAGVACLLIVLALQLALSARRESQTWDEACHIFAGYNYWKNANFGDNPEHPPLVKLLATLPLLRLPLNVPPHPGVFSKEEDFLTATQFVYSNDASAILFRTRMAAALLTLLLGLLVFVVAREMFGPTAAFIALTLLVFEPNILAHGAVVTTDVGMSLFFLATVYTFYRYVKKPTAGRLLLTGLAAGLGLATKHSAILVFPALFVLAGCEVALGSNDAEPSHSSEPRTKRALRLLGALAVIGVIAVVVLWSFYGFHFHPRSGVDAGTRLAEYAGRLKNPVQAKMIITAGRWHLLPQSYLYGLADVGFTAEFSHTYLLGTVYPHGVWPYFPIAFSIKTTLGLLILLALVPLSLARSRIQCWRELLFLIVPAAVYFGVAMGSGMNIGVRHILPVYPFLMILAAWGAWRLIQRQRRWAYVVALLLVWNVVSSLRTFPVYLAYSNELWGGPSQTYKYLSDSNADWGQQLWATKKYLDGQQVKNCWFAYFAEVVVDPAYYGVPCKPLTTIASVWLQPSIDVPASVDGPVLISAGVLSGYEFGPGELNPYDQFQHIQPTAVIEDGLFVFDGHFEIPLAAAMNHVTRAQLAAQNKDLDKALAEAQAAVALAPQSVQTQAVLGDVLRQLNRTYEARQAYQKALDAAESIHPEFQSGWIPGLKHAALQGR